MFDLDNEQLYGTKKNIIDIRWNLSPRQIFQRLGTEFGQYILFDIFPELKDKISFRCFWIKHFEIFLENNKDKNISENEINSIKNIDYVINNNSSKNNFYKQYDNFIYIPF